MLSQRDIRAASVFPIQTPLCLTMPHQPQLRPCLHCSLPITAILFTCFTPSLHPQLQASRFCVPVMSASPREKTIQRQIDRSDARKPRMACRAVQQETPCPPHPKACRRSVLNHRKNPRLHTSPPYFPASVFESDAANP